MNACTWCGSWDAVVEGQWECVATAGDAREVESWAVGLCRACAHRTVNEERRRVFLVAPLKGVLLTFFGLGSALGVYISLEEGGFTLWLAIPFVLLAVRGLVGGVPILFGLPWAMRQILRTRRHLVDGTVDGKDRDLLIYLEAHRALDGLKTGFGQLALPQIANQDSDSIRYELRRAEESR